MYLADSISFKPPSETPQVFPSKKTTYSIIYAPKSIHVHTTLEYFTISSTDDYLEEIKDEQTVNENFVQKVILCVQGSCYGNNLV